MHMGIRTRRGSFLSWSVKGFSHYCRYILYALDNVPLNPLERIFSMNESLIILGIFVLFVMGSLYALLRMITLLIRAIFSKIASHSRSNSKYEENSIWQN
jgi:hypothetical protein